MQGCDASILLDTDPAHGIQSERDSRMNFGIKFTEVIDNIKSEFESSCPGVVSCADIVAMAARDAVTQVKGFGTSHSKKNTVDLSFTEVFILWNAYG